MSEYGCCTLSTCVFADDPMPDKCEECRHYDKYFFKKDQAKKTNGDKIREMTDEQLYRFLWTFKTNSIGLFLEYGGQYQMNAPELRRWIKADESTFVCFETAVGHESTYDQNFNPR